MVLFVIPQSATRMKRVTATAARAVILLASMAIGGRAEARESPWGTLLRNDVEAMHRILRESHPGSVDDQNTWFRQWLAAGRKQALERAKTCDSFEGYVFALRAYGIGFHDGHLGVHSALWRGYRRWAGFLAGHRDGKVIVKVRAEGDPELPPVGSEVVSCDGVPAATLVRRDVFPFAGNPELEREWGRVTPLLFTDEGNPWRNPLPRSCVFLDAGAPAPRTRAVAWRRAPGDLGDQIEIAAEKVKLEFVVRPFGARGVWVGLPTFNAKNEAIMPSLKAAIAAAPSWRDRDPIVFDVRGNGGGNSAWGHQILEGLYGKEYVEAQFASLEAKTYVEWRASAANVAHMERLAEQNIREGRSAEEVESQRRMGRALQEALTNRKPYWRQSFGDEKPSVAAAPAKPPVAGRVFLLTDGSCGSACLDFADMVLALPGTTHVGRTTFADSVYMESRYENLPSGIAELGLAVKVYRNRPRGNNQPYVPRPEHRFGGDIRDTAALERWILGLPVQHASR
jgi:hypothetical protein